MIRYFLMRPLLVGVALALNVGCAQEAPEAMRRDVVSGTQVFENDPELQAELLVARELLRQASTGQVVVDSMYAIAGQAPGSPSRATRPPSRTAMLQDSLNVNRRPGEVIVLLLSKPELAEDEVRITATIIYPMATQPGGRGYETVEYTLAGGASTQRIRTRVQLGVT